MRIPRPTLQIAAAAILMSCTATAQLGTGKHLRTLLGKFVDQQGEAIAGGEVHLAYAPVGAPSGTAVEHQVVTTDDRGRFRFKARPCTRQLLWAIGPKNDQGEHQVSPIRWAAPGAPIDLHATATHPEVTATLRGLDKWAEFGPFRLEFAPGAVKIPALSLPVAEDGTCVLPALPDGRTTADLLDKDGQPITSITLSTFKAKKSLTVRPLQAIPMIVVDAKGAPVPDAVIRQRVSVGYSAMEGLLPQPPGRNVWRVLGTTDKDGKLLGKISATKDPFETSGWQHLMFTAEKDGYGIAHSGFRRHPFVNGKEVKLEDDKKELRFELSENKPKVIRLMRNKDEGFANLSVNVQLGAKIEQLENNGYTHEGVLLHLTTDESGRIRIPSISRPRDELLFALGGGDLLDTFVADDKRRMTPTRAFALHDLRGTDTKGKKEVEINLATFAKVQMRLLTEHGTPAPEAEVMVISREKKSSFECSGWSNIATPDSAGRLSLHLQPGSWAIFARTRLGMSYEKFDVDESEAKQVELRMTPMPTMLGRVVDKDGKPVANAKLQCHSSTWHSGGDRDAVLESIASSLNWNWINSTTTDKDGNFACTFLDLPGMTYEARMRTGKNQTKSFNIVVGEDRVTFTIK